MKVKVCNNMKHHVKVTKRFFEKFYINSNDVSIDYITDGQV